MKRKATVQDELQLKINVINADVVGLYARKTAGILTDLQETELSDKKRKAGVELGSMLKRKKDDQRRSKKFRDDRKKRLAAALSWSKAKHDESEECDPMNRCQGAECKEGRLMKGGPTLKG